MAIEGHTDDRNGGEESTRHMPNLHSIIDHRVDDKLLEHHSHRNENGNDRQHGDILERVHSYP